MVTNCCNFRTNCHWTWSLLQKNAEFHRCLWNIKKTSKICYVLKITSLRWWPLSEFITCRHIAGVISFVTCSMFGPKVCKLPQLIDVTLDISKIPRWKNRSMINQVRRSGQTNSLFREMIREPKCFCSNKVVYFAVWHVVPSC